MPADDFLVLSRVESALVRFGAGIVMEISGPPDAALSEK
jgi:hypothetical protein